MRIRLVPFLLAISVASFVFFFVSSMAIDVVDRHLSAASERAETSLERLHETRIELAYQNKKADSLRTILKAHKHEQFLWLARAIFSETTRPQEMYYVGWVIRNRVEMNYNGKSTYRGVVLDHRQFSAFNSGSSKRPFYVNLGVDYLGSSFQKSWFRALDTARRVMEADSSNRPFSPYTLYFYSEISMPDHNPHPIWASRFSQVSIPGVREERFRFLADFDYDGGPPPATSNSPKTSIVR